MSNRAATWVAVCLGLVSTGLVAGNFVVRTAAGASLDGEVSGLPIALGGGIAAIVVWSLGTLIVRRLPRNVVGWAFIFAALVLALGAFSEVYSSWSDLQATPPAGAGLLTALDEFGGPLFWTPLFGLLLFYPDGRPPPGRWRYVVHATVVVLLTPFLAPFTIPEAANYFWLAMMAVTGLAAGAVVARFRRSRGVERQQMRWAAASGTLVMLGVLVLVGSIPTQEAGNEPAWTLIGPGLIVAGFGSFPIAATIAITRYRLYDLDRLVSRAVTYTSVITVVVGLYLGSVLLVGALVPGARDSDLAVAVSTLAAAAAFQPLQRRIRVSVDKRFHRQRYDAAQALEQLGVRLRDQVHDGLLVASVAKTLTATLRPAHVSVWIRPPTGAET